MLTLIISTIDNRINKLTKLPVNPNIKYIIVHQKSPAIDLLVATNTSILFYQRRSDITYIPSSKLGLSRSRNIGLDNCLTEYAFILDDDIEFYDFESLNQIVIDFEKTQADIFINRVIDSQGSLFKKYPKNGYVYNKLSCASVSSIEISVRVSFVRENNIFFNNDFGLGTNLPSGEEYIFLNDCLKKHARILHRDSICLIHPLLSSGQDFFSNDRKLNAKKEMFKYIFKKSFRLFLFLFFIKKSSALIKNKMFFRVFLLWILYK